MDHIYPLGSININIQQIFNTSKPKPTIIANKTNDNCQQTYKHPTIFCSKKKMAKKVPKKHMRVYKSNTRLRINTDMAQKLRVLRFKHSTYW